MATTSSLFVFSFFVVAIMLAQSTLSMFNVIDSCWRRDPHWELNRQALAECAVGFGRDAGGGWGGLIYVVNDSSDDPYYPKPGTLRHAAAQNGPLWIIFSKSMTIYLKKVLVVSSFKTIDGRGANVHIAHGSGLMLWKSIHVIIHGISIHDIKNEVGYGDAITVSQSSHVWIDHCYFARCPDGLTDVVLGSTFLTISNNFYTQHNEVMLIGNNDKYTPDMNIKITIALNYFGPQLVQRMPRVRFGYAHVANNRYERWGLYAVGGSSGPTIFSEGNYYVASNNRYTKQVTRRRPGDFTWRRWTWKSSKDIFVNGAFFVQSGYGNHLPNYSPSQAFRVAKGYLVPYLTGFAGPLLCTPGKPC